MTWFMIITIKEDSYISIPSISKYGSIKKCYQLMDVLSCVLLYVIKMTGFRHFCKHKKKTSKETTEMVRILFVDPAVKYCDNT
jgi:hypothetical protein